MPDTQVVAVENGYSTTMMCEELTHHQSNPCRRLKIKPIIRNTTGPVFDLRTLTPLLTLRKRYTSRKAKCDKDTKPHSYYSIGWSTQMLYAHRLKFGDLCGESKRRLPPSEVERISKRNYDPRSLAELPEIVPLRDAGVLE
jgi:hypothetical protein